MDRKQKRRSVRSRVSDGRKRQRPMNRFEMEEPSTSQEDKFDSTYNVNPAIGYRLLNFLTVFTALSQYVKCKSCGGEISFSETSIRGLGFKLVVKCDKCANKTINSSPLIKNAYEINTKFVFAMRMIGIGIRGSEKFCAFLDLPRPIFQSFYDKVVSNIHAATKAVARRSMENAAKKEKTLTDEATGIKNSGLTVSGDGSWMKRGFSSLFGIASLIGYHTKSVLDIVIKSSFCLSCRKREAEKGTEEYNSWMEEHAEQCTINHEGSAGKMGVDSICEMFSRSEDLYNARYTSYIGDGDTKTFKAIIDSKPYKNTSNIKKECINHVKKRMGSRLRNLKKNHKGLGGKGKLTDKVIDEMCNYYGKSIRENTDSVENMRNSIWATLKHKSSNDDKPQHENCPQGENSWCTWQRAKAANDLDNYHHKKPLPQEVVEAITPVYEDLTRDELLVRCLGGFTQNLNESFNAIVWKFAPKTTSSRACIVETAAYLAVILFNEGIEGFVHILQLLNIQIGPILMNYCLQYSQYKENTTTSIEVPETLDRDFAAPKRNRRSKIVLKDDKDMYYAPGIDELW